MTTSRIHLFGFLSIVAFGNQAAWAADAATCDAKVVAQVRNEAQKKLRVGAFAEAEKLLTPLLAACIFSGKDVGNERQPNRDFYWVRSDLSYVQFKLGKYGECLKLLAPLTYPSPPDGISANGLDDDRVATAVGHNEALCEDAATKRFVKLSQKRCPGVTQAADAHSAISLPVELSEQGRYSCLQLEPGASSTEFRRGEGTSDKPADVKKLCPQLFATGPSNLRTAISASEGALANAANCCNVDTLSAGIVDGQHIVRIRGQGRDCFGGTALTIIDEIYTWNGTELKLSKSLSRSPH